MKNRYTLLIAFILAGLAVFHVSTSVADTPAVPMGDAAEKPALTKRKPVFCNDSDDVVLDKVIIESDGPAVTINASCDITIKNSVIRTAQSAVVINGSGDLTIIDSTVESKAPALQGRGSGDFVVRGSQISGEFAAKLDGSGDLKAKDSRFRGKKVSRGTGEYEDEGGNTWE